MTRKSTSYARIATVRIGSQRIAHYLTNDSDIETMCGQFTDGNSTTTERRLEMIAQSLDAVACWMCVSRGAAVERDA